MFGVFRSTTRKNEEIRGSQKTYPINRKIRVSARFLCEPACHTDFNGLRAGFLCRKESGDKELLAFGGYPLENLHDPESFNAKIKAFRTQFRGVRNIPLEKLFDLIFSDDR